MRSRAFFALVSAAAALTAFPASAMQYEVGPGKTYTSPCKLFAAVTLAAGDVILVDAGTYTDACQITQSGSAAAPIQMMGAPGPRPLFDGTGNDLSGAGSVPRAIFQFTGASHWRVSHLELENASGSSGNGAAFRATAGSDDDIVSDNSIHDCQDGLMSDGSGTFTIQGNEIFHNGANDGQTHNMYLDSDTVRIVGNYIHDSNGGQNVKLRVHYGEVLYNFIANAGNYEMDLIQGSPLTDEPNSNVVLIGNVVLRNPNAANDGQTIVFGSDNPAQAGRDGSFYAIANTFVMTAATNKLVHAISPAAGAKIYFFDNIVHATVAGTSMSYDATTEALFSGSNNWVTTGVTAPAALTAGVGGTSPGFVGATDFHLTAGAPVIGKGTSALTYIDGKGATQNGTPVSEFAAFGGGAYGSVNRLQNGAIDLGAYQFGTPDGGAPPPGDGGTTGGGDGGTTGGADGGTTRDGGAVGDSGPVTFRPDSGGDGGGSNGDSGSNSGCGCTVVGSQGAGTGAVAGALALLVILRARSARRTSRAPRGVLRAATPRSG